MWIDRRYIVNDKVVGNVWFRKGERLWKWGYTGGFIETTEDAAKKQVERQARK